MAPPDPPSNPATGEPVTAEHLIQQSDALDEAFKNGDYAGLVTQVAGLRELQKRQTIIVRAVAIVAVVAIVAGLFGTYYALRVDHNAREIANARDFAAADAANLRILCERGNDDNAKRKALWQFVLDTIDNAPNVDPTFTTGLTQLVDTAYAPTDCNPTDSTPPGVPSTSVP